jgi:glycosyltransferase involved in cell wall biosynthesis
VDVIHSHTPMLGLGAMRAVSGNSTLRIHSIHSPWLMEMRAGGNWEGKGSLRGRILSRAAFAVAKQVEASCFSHTDFLTSDSGYTKKEIIREHARTVKKKRFEVFPGWVDTNRFTPDGPRTNWQTELGRLSKGPVFFTIRGLAPRYGLEMLIDAAGLVKQKGLDFELVIGGDGPLRSALLSQIRDLSLEDSVTLIGRVEDDRLPILYRSCDVFVLPTLALECFGIIILEALASGKPVIATPVGAIPELLKPIFPQGLLPETSVQALADTMIRHIRAIENGRPIGDHPDKFRNYVDSHYSMDVGTRRFKELYESSIITHRSR